MVDFTTDHTLGPHHHRRQAGGPCQRYHHQRHHHVVYWIPKWRGHLRDGIRDLKGWPGLTFTITVGQLDGMRYNVSYQKLDQNGDCRDGDDRSAPRFTRVYKRDLGPDYAYTSICQALCSRIGPRCIGIQVQQHAYTKCAVLGAGLVAGDGGEGEWSFYPGSGTAIVQTSGDSSYSCYQKKKTLVIGQAQTITRESSSACLPAAVNVAGGGIGEGSTAVVTYSERSTSGPVHEQRFVVPVRVNTGCRSLSKFRLMIEYDSAEVQVVGFRSTIKNTF